MSSLGRGDKLPTLIYAFELALIIVPVLLEQPRSWIFPRLASTRVIFGG